MGGVTSTIAVFEGICFGRAFAFGGVSVEGGWGFGNAV
jgi:hypothetical protein